MKNDETIKSYVDKTRKPHLRLLMETLLGDVHSIDRLLQPQHSLDAVADPIHMNGAKVAVLDRIAVIEGKLVMLRGLVLGVQQPIDITKLPQGELREYLPRTSPTDPVGDRYRVVGDPIKELLDFREEFRSLMNKFLEAEKGRHPDGL